MAILHRLRFEADTGMHRMTIAECPVELRRFGLIQLDDDGKPVITVKGRQALKHYACVRALNSIQCGLDAPMMSEEIRTWLESNMFLQRIGNDYQITELGNSWLEFNRSISQNRAVL
jgi:predicted transcriptional regulator